MNRILIFARRAATALAFAALGVAALSSCETTEEVLASLDTPQPRLVSSTVSTLTFTWDKVANTVQYTYELLSADGTSVDGGVTPGLKAEFTGLKDNTTYTFRLMAHPEVYSESYGSSQESLLAAQTVAIRPLDTPSLTVDLEGGVTVSWSAVDNASYYEYTCTSDNGTDISGSTYDTAVTFNGLKSGDYVVSVKAISENEAYSDSQTAYTTFPYIETKNEIWKVNGSVDDGAGKTWTATLVAWSNGSYTIKGWYGTEGYDLEFYVNSDATITVTNKITSDGYDYVAANADEWICIDTNNYEGYGAYSSFSGTKLTGEIWFWSYETNGYYDFVWNSGSGKALTIDDLVGTYTQNNTYQFWYNGTWNNYASTNDITITKVDDTTVSIEGFMYTVAEGGKVINATVDTANSTLSIAPQMVDEWYKLAGQNAETDSVTAAWDDGTITFGDWSLWYDGYAYAYSTATVLTKK